MAETTQKNKNANTFRFKSFAERVNEIDIRRLALYHIGHENEELPEDNETYFHQTLKKWMVLNLSDEFTHFSRKCMKIVTLPQLLHKKEFVIDLLLERLATATNLSLQPLLELLYVLARDLREEFYPYFQRVLDRLICLLNTQDAEQLEWSLVCLAYLFKSLKPYLKRNIGVVFHAILPLLDEQRFEEHITNFAVECFSFIARDLRDYRKFLNFILETVVSEQVDSVQGCGRLLFETVRGVKGLFHSVASEFLQFIFETLVDEKLKSREKSQLLCEIVECALRELLKFLHPSSMSLFWSKLCAVAMSTGSTAKIQNLINVFLQAAAYRDGRYLAELDVIVPTILRMLDNCQQAANADEALELLVTLVSKILLSNCTQITQLDTSRLMKKVLSIEQRVIFEQFIQMIAAHAQFEILILPTVMTYFECHFDVQAFELLARIVVLKQPLAENGLRLKNWKIYALQVKNVQILKQLTAKMEKLNFSTKNELELEESLLLLIVLPHIVNLEKSKALQKHLQSETQKLLEKMQTQDKNIAERNFVILALLLETQIHLNFKLSNQILKQIVGILLPHSANNMTVLSCIDQILTRNAALLKDDSEIHVALSPLLSSHSHEVRLTAAHSLHVMMHRNNADSVDVNPYRIFYEAESIEPNIHNYREQLLLLQKLQTAGEFFKSLQDENFKVDTLRFLLGLLYNNFKFVWEPVQKLIEEYAKVLPLPVFWEIYREKLEATEQAIDYDNAKEEQLTTENETCCWQNGSLNEILLLRTSKQLTQQELQNYRNLLWSHMPKYGQLVEVKNRDLVSMFLQFINEEYRKYLERREFTWNLKAANNNNKNNKQELTFNADELVEEMDSDAEEHQNDDNANESSHKIKRRHSKRNKNKIENSSTKFILQTLQSKLGIFVAQPNPKALYREPELYAVYMDLLAGPNNALQKLALDCVMTYKWKALMPYKEQLYAFVDELKFKDELINFKMESVQADYREQLMHILLRLLYGKMIAKATQRTGSTQVRKAVILRFLGQCSTAEILWFLQMAFGHYSKYTNVANFEQIPALLAADFDLHSVCSAKKLQSVVNLLELIRKEFGGLLEQDFQIYMLKLLVLVGCVSNMVIQSASSAELHPKMPAVYRNVKNAALNSLVNFFSHISDFPWQPEQIKCLSEIFVWPNIEKLSQDSIHTPTALLKLLLVWGEKAQHFGYLNQKCEQQPTTQVIFHYIIELLLYDKTKMAVRKPIMELIERLLVCAGATNSDYSAQALDIFKPFIGQILKRLKLNFSTRSAKKALDKRDLNILSLLTAHVESAEICDSLLQLLLPILIAKSQSSASDEIVCQVINTLANLIKRLDAPETYLLKIAPLFEQVHEVTARKLLCDLVADIAKIRHKQFTAKGASAVSEATHERLKDTARLILMLNAWDKRWVEQPDYDKRLDALKEVTQKLEAGSVSMDLGVLIIYNCFYFIKYDKDMGMRDNASEHLKVLLPKLTQKYANDKLKLDYLIGDVFINLVRRIIHDHNDNVRNEGIRLLGEMCRQCPESHEILQDLAPLADRQDVEVDFFENMTHLQTHRHGRALLKFCAHAETLTQLPNARTLTQFLLPLATRYLLQEKYASKHTLVDAAIETVGVICHLLPWQHYHAVLRYYLMKLRSTHDYQKQCVRIVVNILDAFHFDLSQVQQGGVDEQAALQQLKDELNKKEKAELNDASKQQNKAPKSTIKKEKNAEEDEETDAGEEEEEAENDDDDNLDNALTAANESSTEDLEQSSHVNAKKELVLRKSIVLSINASKRIMLTITTILIPTLNRSITEKSSYDAKHKVNRKRFSAEREDEEILRVPIALALVKLMQKLPKTLLDTSLPGVFMKVCTFLRSPLKSVRMLTRDILKKIMLTLGSHYLPMLMDHLQTLLTHGFQVHVLAVTTHGVLDALRDQLKLGDIENCLKNLLEVALNDIFGDITNEKEIDKITAHTPEAKPSAKSYLVLHIIARNIQETCLLDLLLPFKDYLARSHSRKMTLKIQDCFAKIVAGLVENPHISRESLLIFIYGAISESITDLLPAGAPKRVLSEQEKEKMRRARPDCYLIQPEPRMRSGCVRKQVKSNAQANAHILVEFGLDMLNIVLKRKKLVEVDYQPFVNPILPLLSDALKSTHIRVTTFALKCLTSIWNDEYELPELQQYLVEIVARMFEILKNFSTFGATKQEDNRLLVKSVFKAIVALLRKCTSYHLTAEQIDQLVLHIEQDLLEGESQSMSFSLLKALLVRKVNKRPIHDIMRKMSELSIVSHSDYVRDEARALIAIYIMEYPLKKRVDQIVKFFCVHLCYSQPSGRHSAIKFLTTIIRKFPQSILNKRSEFLYLSLATRLVNDEEADCRRAIAECMELMLARLEKFARQRLFDITVIFFDNNNKPTVREMAAALCSRFLNVEKQAFAARLKLVLPKIVARLTLSDPNAAGRFVRAPQMLGQDVDAEDVLQPLPKKSKKNKRSKFSSKTTVEDILPQQDAEAMTEDAIARRQRDIDHEIIQMQYCLMKMFEYCGKEMFENEDLANTIDELAYESQKLLGHDHTWVRCNASKIIAHILAHYDYEMVGKKLCKLADCESMKLDFVYLNPEYDIKSLVLDLCAQMIPGNTPQPMIDEIVKIFLYIANMLRDVPFKIKKEQVDDEQVRENAELVMESSNTKINLNWLMHNIRYLIGKEVAKAPHATSMRSALFTLIEGFITLLSVESLEKLAPTILLSLVREMSEEDQNVVAELRQQALRIGSRLRKRIGSDIYDKLRSKVQMKLMIRRADRKKIIAQEKIHDPVRAAKRKIGIQERKKAAKKLKTNVIRGKTADIKQKLKKRKRKAEDELF